MTHVLCGFSIEYLKTSREFSALFESTVITSCCFIVSFRWPIPVLNRPEKSVISSTRYISVAMSYLLEVGYETFFTNSVPSSNFAYSATVKPRPSADYIGRKISVLPPTQLVFTVIELIILQQILQISGCF